YLRRRGGGLERPLRRHPLQASQRPAPGGLRPLPRRGAGELRQGQAPSGPGGESLMPKKILVAVRDMLFSSKIDAAAKSSGTAVAWASRAEKLPAIVAAEKPEALLVDLGQPGMLEDLAAVKKA